MKVVKTIWMMVKIVTCPIWVIPALAWWLVEEGEDQK